MGITYLMRPLIGSRFGIDSDQKLLKEFHFKKFNRLMIERERSTMRMKNNLDNKMTYKEIFSCFSDSKKYFGIIPSSNNFRAVYSERDKENNFFYITF